MRKRESHYPVILNVRVSSRFAARLNGGADRYEVPASRLARMAMEGGLRGALDRLRKERRELRSGDGGEGGSG